MKLLNGQELADFIKERQATQVRSLIQSKKINPKLAVVVCNQNPAINKYVSLKKHYGADISVGVDIHKIDQHQVIILIKKLNKDNKTHGIIVQLPLADPSQTDEIVNSIVPDKDVDGLGKNSELESAAPLAITWLLAGNNIDLKNKQVTIVGQGRLVGAPLKKLLENSGIKPKIIIETTKNREKLLQDSQIIITAVGQPGVLSAKDIPQNCAVIDAGTASEGNQIKGDLADDVYEREDLIITPKIGGVGQLTVCALFENVIRAAGRI